MKQLEQLLNEISQYYISEFDLYYCQGKIILELNELIYLIKKIFDNKYYRLFEKTQSPFGYWDHYSMVYNDLSEMNFNTTKNFTFIDRNSGKREEYNLSSRADNDELNMLLEKTISLYNYVTEIGDYLGHPITNNVERF